MRDLGADLLGFDVEADIFEQVQHVFDRIERGLVLVDLGAMLPVFEERRRGAFALRRGVVPLVLVFEDPGRVVRAADVLGARVGDPQHGGRGEQQRAEDDGVRNVLAEDAEQGDAEPERGESDGLADATIFRSPRTFIVIRPRRYAFSRCR